MFWSSICQIDEAAAEEEAAQSEALADDEVLAVDATDPEQIPGDPTRKKYKWTISLNKNTLLCLFSLVFLSE